MTDNEKRAHDLALAYEIYFSLKHSDDIISPDGFVANYTRDFKKFMELLED